MVEIGLVACCTEYNFDCSLPSYFNNAVRGNVSQAEFKVKIAKTMAYQSAVKFLGDEPVALDNVPSHTSAPSDVSVSEYTQISDGTSPKCYLGSYAFRCANGHLLLAKDVKEGTRVKITNQQCAATVTFVEAFRCGENQWFDISVLSTAQGTFEVSPSHRVVTNDGPKRAGDLNVGDSVMVGTRAQRLSKVKTERKKTDLYAITFDPEDGIVEAIPVSKFGLQTLGETVSPNGSVSASSSGSPTSNDRARHDPDWILLNICGGSNVTAEELEAAMPTSYED
eukprot:TRINITY_DN32602_c0_g1_i1.p1 TRINITY_DN32602_c0_g1~~TRINITY_DN32602_c0_g1_i1.p1  ORF type:complete len:281 (+),score=49.50 TRINITY_DN32602_c0_g1_i1:234-1076(+)